MSDKDVAYKNIVRPSMEYIKILLELRADVIQNTFLVAIF